MDLQQLLGSSQALPSIPKVIALIMAELNEEDPDLIKVSSLLAQEPVLASRLLQMANSAKFELAQQISNIPEALAVVGFRDIRALVCAEAVKSAFRQVGGIDLKEFWQYSRETARLSRKLISNNRLNVTAFTAGLIHATGELVMHLGMPEAMQQLNDRMSVFSLQRAATERELFGFSYAQVGAGLARAWNFPSVLVEVFDHHDAPFTRGNYEPLSGVVHLAAWSARAKELGYCDADLVETFPDEVAMALNLDMDQVLERDGTGP